jgi:hypothetical protein
MSVPNFVERRGLDRLPSVPGFVVRFAAWAVRPLTVVDRCRAAGVDPGVLGTDKRDAVGLRRLHNPPQSKRTGELYRRLSICFGDAQLASCLAAPPAERPAPVPRDDHAAQGAPRNLAGNPCRSPLHSSSSPEVAIASTWVGFFPSGELYDLALHLAMLAVALAGALIFAAVARKALRESEPSVS